MVTAVTDGPRWSQVVTVGHRIGEGWVRPLIQPPHHTLAVGVALAALKKDFGTDRRSSAASRVPTAPRRHGACGGLPHFASLQSHKTMAGLTVAEYAFSVFIILA